MSSRPDRQLELGDSLGRGSSSLSEAYKAFNEHSHSGSTALFTDLPIGLGDQVQVVSSSGQLAFPPETFIVDITDTEIQASAPALRTIIFGSLIVNSAFQTSGIEVYADESSLYPADGEASFSVLERRLCRLRHAVGSFTAPVANTSYPILMKPGHSGYVDRLTVNCPIGNGRVNILIDDQTLEGTLVLGRLASTTSYSGLRSKARFGPDSIISLRFHDSSRGLTPRSQTLGAVRQAQDVTKYAEDGLVSSSSKRRSFTGLGLGFEYYVRVLTISNTGETVYYSNEPSGSRPVDHLPFVGNTFGPIDSIAIIPVYGTPTPEAQVVLQCSNSAGLPTTVVIAQGPQFVEDISVGGSLALITSMIRADNTSALGDTQLGQSLLPLRQGKGQVLGALYYVRIRLRAQTQVYYFSNEPPEIRPLGYTFIDVQVLGGIHGIFGAHTTFLNENDSQSFYLRSEAPNGTPSDFFLVNGLFGYHYDDDDQPIGLKGSGEVIYVARVDGTSEENDILQGTVPPSLEDSPTAPLGTNSTSLIGALSTQDSSDIGRPLLTLDRLKLRPAVTPQVCYCLEFSLVPEQ
jgi:hypothetical protein